MEKITLVLGASLKPERYSNKAIHALIDNNQGVMAFGLIVGSIRGVEVHNKLPQKTHHGIKSNYIKSYF